MRLGQVKKYRRNWTGDEFECLDVRRTERQLILRVCQLDIEHGNSVTPAHRAIVLVVHAQPLRIRLSCLPPDLKASLSTSTVFGRGAGSGKSAQGTGSSAPTGIAV